MVGANVKAEAMSMMERRSAMETEMNTIIARLCTPGGPGLSGNLLDAEGFPRADIDIPAVRADRNRLAVLRSDHKEITEKIEKNLHVLHSGGFTRDSSMLPTKRNAEGEELRQQRMISVSTAGTSVSPYHLSNQESPTPMEEDLVTQLPFAIFDEVMEGSPAALDGILLGDQLLKFGSVEGGENLLSKLAREGRIHEGRAIPVIVMRRGTRVQLTVTPRPWSGHGLLGCHIQPL